MYWYTFTLPVIGVPEAISAILALPLLSEYKARLSFVAKVPDVMYSVLPIVARETVSIDTPDVLSISSTLIVPRPLINWAEDPLSITLPGPLIMLLLVRSPFMS